MTNWIQAMADWPRADLLSLAQTVLTVVGFAFTIWQVMRSVSATKDTTRELATLRGRFATNDLLVAIPRLHTAEDNLLTCLKLGTAAEVEQSLISLSRLSNEIAARLEVRTDEESVEMRDSLMAVAKTATKAKASLASGSATPSYEQVKPVTKALDKLSGQASQMVVRLQREAGE